jgi:hypothetical protein
MKTTKEFCLSDKVEEQCQEDIDEFELSFDERRWYFEKDVKEFIKRLKEFTNIRAKTLELNKNNPRMNWETSGTTELSNILFMIDKLAGERLTK